MSEERIAELETAMEALSAKNSELLREVKIARAKAKGVEIDPNDFMALQTENETLKSQLDKTVKDSTKTIETLQSSLNAALKQAQQKSNSAAIVQKHVAEEFSMERLVSRMDAMYQQAWSEKRRYEVPILTYHRIVQTKEEGGSLPIWVTAAQFEEHLQILKEEGFTTLTVSDLATMPTLAERFHPDWKPILLTFDDGYEDNYTLLFPLLQRYGFTATIFLVAGMKQNLWDKDITDFASAPLLSDAHIREMQRYGIDFGSHSMTHPRLGAIPLAAAAEEIRLSKQVLEERLGREVNSFCYPYGSLSADVKRLVSESGYLFGIASDSGSLFLHEDVLEVRRIGVFPNTTAARFRRKITGGYVFRSNKTR